MCCRATRCPSRRRTPARATSSASSTIRSRCSVSSQLSRGSSRRRRRQPIVLGGFGTVPAIVLVAFQLMFAIITVALISGAVAERMKFGTWLVFGGLWATFVYFPLSHMVWGGGLLSGRTRASPPRCSAWLKRRRQRRAHRLRRWHRGAHQRRYGRPGAGDPAGQAQRASARRLPPAQPAVRDAGRGHAVVRLVRLQRRFRRCRRRARGSVFVNTTVATAAAMLAWLLVERIRDGQATSWVPPRASSPAWSPSRRRASSDADRVAGPRRGRRCAVGAGRRPEVQVRLRRFARRGRRAPGRRSVGHHRRSGSSPPRRGLFYGGDFKQLVVQFVIALSARRSFTAIMTAHHRLHREAVGLAGVRGGRGHRHR